MKRETNEATLLAKTKRTLTCQSHTLMQVHTWGLNWRKTAEKVKARATLVPAGPHERLLPLPSVGGSGWGGWGNWICQRHWHLWTARLGKLALISSATRLAATRLGLWPPPSLRETTPKTTNTSPFPFQPIKTFLFVTASVVVVFAVGLAVFKQKFRKMSLCLSSFAEMFLSSFFRKKRNNNNTTGLYTLVQTLHFNTLQQQN